MLSGTYLRRRKEKLRQRAMAGVAARERKRLAVIEGPDWKRVRTLLVGVYAHKDGRHVGLWINGHEWKMGGERAVRALLARELYREVKR